MDPKRTAGETPFEEFRRFTRKLLAVPKAEIVAKEREYKRKRARKRQSAR